MQYYLSIVTVKIKYLNKMKSGKQSLSIIQKDASAVIDFIKPAAQLTVTATASGFVTLGATIPTGANYALIEVEASGTDSIRFWITGENPTSSIGFRRFDKEYFDIEGANNLNKFKCLTSGTVKLNVMFGVKR
jgi:hypothetical protein